MQLQGKGKTLIDLILGLNSFKGKLNMLTMQLKRHGLKHYQNLIYSKYDHILDIDHESVAQKLSNFLGNTNLAGLEEEIINFKCDKS